MDDSDARLNRLEQRIDNVERVLRDLQRRLDTLAPAEKPKPDPAFHLIKAREERHRNEEQKKNEQEKEEQPADPFEVDLIPLSWANSDSKPGTSASTPQTSPVAPPLFGSQSPFIAHTAPPPGPSRAPAWTPQPPPGESTLSIIVANLRQLGVLPPVRTGTIEVQIGSWWMTRLGMLLGVIGVASFGIYVTRNTPAWLRLAEMIFLSGAITAGGWWLERKLPRFGEVVFGGGLALLYFSAFGAYAIPGIRVIYDPTVGLFAQLAAVIVIGILALLRRSQTLSTMAAVFGFTACLFSIRWGLEWSALVTALVIHAGAIYLFLSRRWFQPLFVSIAGVWVIYGATFFLHWLTQVHAGYERAIAYLACVMAATIAADWFSVKLEKLPPRQPRLIMQYLNTSGAIALAFLVTYVLYPGRLDSTYFIFGAILLAASVVYYLTHADFNLMHGFFIKATALITLGVIAHYSGYARWVALAVQSAILLASAWRTRIKVTEGAAVIAWVLSFFFLIKQLVGVDPAILIITRDGLLAFAWIAISAAVLSLYGRLFEKGEEMRRQLLMAMGLAFGIGVAMIGLRLVDPQWRPIALTALSAALVIYALAPRHWVTLLAALPPFAVAHIAQWRYGSGTDVRFAWLNESLVIEYTFAIAVCLNLAIRKYPRLEYSSEARRAVVFAHMLWMLTLFAVPFATFAFEEFILMGVAVAWVATALTFIENAGLPARITFWPMIYVLALFAYARFNNVNRLGYVHFDFYLGLAMLGAFVHLVSTWRPGPFRARPVANDLPGLSQHMHLWAVVLLVHVVLLQMYSREDLLWAYCFAAVAFGSLAWLTEIRAALAGAIYFIVMGQLACYFWNLNESLLLPGLVLALLTLGLAPAVRRLPSPPSADTLRTFQWIVAFAALALADLLFFNQSGPEWTHFTTVAWGVAAVIVVAAGFIDRAKPLRLVGLAGLAICIPRAFIVDIHSMLYRIAAFILLGAALLTVGFIYNKYQKVIERIETD